MTIYIDTDFKCYTSNLNSTLIAIETNFFDGKCQAYIEGYRFVPAGESWIREDGMVFNGEMISPWKDWRELDSIQRDYEKKQIEALTAENKELISDMAQIVDEVYQSDIETLGI